MDLKELDRRAKRRGFLLLYATIIATSFSLVACDTLYHSFFPEYNEVVVIIGFISTIFATLFLAGTINFFIYSYKGNTILHKDFHLLAEIINGSPCQVTKIILIRDGFGFVKRKDLYFSFDKEDLLIREINFSSCDDLRRFVLKEGTNFTIENVKLEYIDFTQTKIKKIE